MKKYYFPINNEGKDEELVIFQPEGEDGRYRVELEGETVGYLFYSEMNPDKGCSMWEATTPSLTLIAAQLGEFIEQSAL